jgi:hypothetical protein
MMNTTTLWLIAMYGFMTINLLTVHFMGSNPFTIIAMVACSISIGGNAYKLGKENKP